MGSDGVVECGTGLLEMIPDNELKLLLAVVSQIGALTLVYCSSAPGTSGEVCL